MGPIWENVNPVFIRFPNKRQQAFIDFGTIWDACWDLDWNQVGHIFAQNEGGGGAVRILPLFLPRLRVLDCFAVLAFLLAPFGLDFGSEVGPFSKSLQVSHVLLGLREAVHGAHFTASCCTRNI